ncbi:heme ABC transporter permease [Parvularcula marina]|uniref:heme ABC transporter permease n=1 Tax=Parvularcula marina TaxID=2292771 RepID=UPI0035137E1F
MVGKTLSKLANPALFMRVSGPIVPIAGVLALLLIGAGTVMAYFFSPPDARQGEAVRIMYVHVPAAWLALQTYAVIAIASLVGFVWRHRLADVIAKVSAPFGLACTVLALMTGMLWGKVTWGVYWDWDPRLTSMLVLLFLYAGYIALWAAIENEATAARICALLAMLGAVNLPIIKFSVDWWDSLHQKATVIRTDGPAMPASMLWPLLLMAFGYMALSAFYTLIRTRSDLRARKAKPGESKAPSAAVMEPAE